MLAALVGRNAAGLAGVIVGYAAAATIQLFVLGGQAATKPGP